MDAAGEVVAVMSLSAGSGLGFGQREQLQPEILPALRGRWQPVTVPDMVRRGARKYAWIPPNEEVCAAAGKWKAPPYGCFAYIFHDDEGAEDERDCYFPVAEMSTQGEVRSLNSKIKRDTPAADGAGHFEVTKASLTVFESPDSRRRLGLLRKGDLVFTKGPAKEVAGFTMQPIAPRGAVESKFLRPVGPSGAAIKRATGAEAQVVRLRAERELLRAEAAALRGAQQLQPPAARAPVQLMRRCRNRLARAARSGELARVLLQLRPG